MTREELAKAIREDYIRQGVWAVKTTNITMNLDFEMLEIIREALEQEPCEDTISRQAAIVQLSHNKTGDDDCDVIIQKDIETIKALPSVTPQPKTGHWIDEGFYADGHSQHAYRCSKCDEHYIGYEGEYKYCPNCGAKMSEIPTDCSNLDSCENCKYDDGECCRLLYEAKMESEE